MKRFIIAICAFVTIICVGIVSLCNVKYSYNILAAKVDDIQNTAINNRELSIQGVDNLAKEWDIRKKVLMHHVRHYCMDEIAISLERAKVYAREEKTVALESELAVLKWLFYSMLEDEQITAHNIF